MIGRKTNEQGLTEEEVRILAATDKAWPITTENSAKVDARTSRYKGLVSKFKELFAQGKVYNRHESPVQTTSQVDLTRADLTKKKTET